MINKLDTWHKTKRGLLFFTVIELIAAYIFAGAAIDRGTWWWYLLTIVFLVGGLQNFFKLIGKLFHGAAKRR